MDRFLELFGHLVEFTYAVWDRIVLRGYYERLQRPQNIVYFFRDICGIRCITPSALARRTEGYRRWVEGYARRRRIPILLPPKGVKKEDFVADFYRRFRRPEGVVAIVKSMEQGPTFVSYEPQYPPPSGDDYRIIKRASAKQYLHYYFYVLDPVMGPMSLRVGTYLPFTVGCYMNGHSYLDRRLRQAGVPFRKDDNAIVACADPNVLRRLGNALDERVLHERASYWAWRLAPSFTPRERTLCGLQYRWSVAQIEFAQDVIFRRSAPLQNLFRRATEIGVALGGATQTRQIFGRRINKRYHGKLETVLEHRDAGHPVLRAYYQTSYVKQYEKGDRLLRTETCVNDPYHLGVGRHLENLPKLKAHLTATTDRYLAQQAELLDSTVDTGALAALAQPILVGKRRIPGIKLHDDRIIRALDALLYTGGLLGDWTTRDLYDRILARHRIPENDYSLAQLRYDLQKLRAHQIAERIGNTRRYRLTPKGVRIAAVLVKARDRLLGPILASPAAKRSSRSTNPSTVEGALRKIDKALDALCDEIGLKRAA
jgi:hypothetical protein